MNKSEVKLGDTLLVPVRVVAIETDCVVVRVKTTFTNDIAGTQVLAVQPCDLQRPAKG